VRVLILSKEGVGASIAYKLSLEGHSVDLWIEDGAYKDTLKGYVNRPDSWRPLTVSADLVLSDSAGFSKYGEVFGRLGKPMIGFNLVGDVLELNYRKGAEALNKVGIKTPAYLEAETVSEALQLDWQSDNGYVVNVYGEDYICQTEEIYNWVLSKLKPSDSVYVYENLKTDKTVEVYIEGWFNGINWVEPFNQTLCIEDGAIVMPVDKMNKLIKSTIFRLTPVLSLAGYRGPVSLKCIVTETDVYVVCIKCSFNDESIDALMTGLTEPVGAFLFDISTGVKKQMNLAKSVAGFDFLGSSEVCVEYEKDEDNKGLPICGLTDQDMKFTYLYHVYKGQSCIYATGADDHLLTATAFGRSVKEVQHRINKLGKNIKSLEVYYADNFNDADRDINLLKEWGWI
jgi:hypothetical protein